MAKETETSGSKKPNYHFMRLPQGHVNNPEIKRLIFHYGAEGYLIYMQLLDMTISNTGFLEFRHVEDSIEAQIAFDLGITEDKARDIVNFLEKLGLVERIKENPQEDDPGGLLFTEGAMYTASETPGAARQRRYMERKRARESEQASQNDGQASQNDDNKNKSKNENSEQEAIIRPLVSENSYSLGENPAAACGGAAGAAPAPPASSPLSSSFLDKIRELNGKKKKNRLSEAGLATFAAETNEGTELWGKPIEGGLSKALNSWAKKTAEKGKHAEYFDDGTGQNAAAPDGAGQDHAGQDHAGQDGTSAAPGKAAPDRAAPDQAGNSTSAETAAKEKELEAKEKKAREAQEAAQAENEALKKQIEEMQKAAENARQQAERRTEEIEKAKRQEIDLQKRIQKYMDRCAKLDKSYSCDAGYPCHEGGCDNCAIEEKTNCRQSAYSFLKNDHPAAFDILGPGGVSYLQDGSYADDETRFYLSNIDGVTLHYGELLLDDPFKTQEKELRTRPDIVQQLKHYYADKSFHGIPEAIARKELSMPLPFEKECI